MSFSDTETSRDTSFISTSEDYSDSSIEHTRNSRRYRNKDNATPEPGTTIHQRNPPAGKDRDKSIEATRYPRRLKNQRIPQL